MKRGISLTCPRGSTKEVGMEDNVLFNQEEPRCEEKCVLEWVDCVEIENGSARCKTRERNCFGECT